MEDFNLIEYITSKRDHGIIVWMFNIGTEKFWNKDNYSIKDTKENVIVNHIEEMNLLLTRKQDILILRNKPCETYLSDLEKAGFEIPRILCPGQKNEEKSIAELVLDDEVIISELTKLGDSNEIRYFVPYGVSYLEEQIAHKCHLFLVGSISQINKKINNKVFSRKLAENLGLFITEGEICNSLQEVEAAYYNLKKRFNKVIIKQPFGASGKGLYIVDSDNGMKSVLLILSRFIRINHETEWIVEGWYDKKADINYQVYVSKTGKVNTFCIKEQMVKNTVYIGSLIPPRISVQTYNKYIEYGNLIGKELFMMGFNGILGIDSIITVNDIIVPVIEINARFTLSTYISFLENKYPNRLIYSFYEKLQLVDGMNYEMFQKLLIDKTLMFNRQNNEGVLCYTSETINSDATNNNGRLFILIVAKSYTKVEEYKTGIGELIKKISHNWEGKK